MLRFASLSLLFALAGCSFVVDGRIEGRVASCTGVPDGKPCVGGDRCFADQCRYTFCGDGIVDPNEECDDGNLLGGDGCEPVTCTHSCDGDTPCPDDGNACNGPESCTASTHLCSSGPEAGAQTPCTAGGETGACTQGFCVRPGCGDGTVDPASDEECEPPTEGCRPNCTWECEGDGECPTSDPCTNARACDLGAHRCEDLGPLSCDDGDACTADSCNAGVGGCKNTPIDADGDGYAPQPLVCAPGSSLQSNDCDDADPFQHPGAPEVANGEDDDCNGAIDDGVVTVVCYRDADGDTYGDQGQSVSPIGACPSGYVPMRGAGFDCNDQRADVSPGVPATSFFEKPHCADARAPIAVDATSGSYSCEDGTTPSYDYDCDGLPTQEFPLTRAQACAAGCNASGWVLTTPPCGGIGQFGACIFAHDACINAPGTLKTQACR